jgi:catechol 2,3-dioxygenase-like lactoylglutathione lyase family enzyme
VVGVSEDVVPTYGLTHIALKVADPQASFRFYQRLLGARMLAPTDKNDDDDLGALEWIEFGIPGAHDVITLRRADGAVTGATGELEHFGFRLTDNEDPDAVAHAVQEAGGAVLDKGRFSNGTPYVFARDRDGYMIELWYEPDPEWRGAGSRPRSAT